MSKLWVCLATLAVFLALQGIASAQIQVVKDEEIFWADQDDWYFIYDYRYENFSMITGRGPRDVIYESSDAIAVCDLNGDVKNEIIRGSSISHNVYVTQITSGFGFREIREATRDVGFEGEDDLACGDVDGDGKAEIVVGDSSEDRALIIQVNDDWTTWTAAIDLPHGFWGGDRIAVGDVNGDGIEEIIVADTDDDRIHIYKYLGGGGDNKGREIKSFEVKFKVNNRETVQYDVEDEITCGDVNGDGIDEIIYGNGYDTHKIYVFNADGDLLFEFRPLYNFDSGDELAAGDVNMDGKDEIIIGDAGSGKIYAHTVEQRSRHLYILPLIGEIDEDYETGDGLAVGDIFGNSFVVEEVGCKEEQVVEQPIVIICSPPKHVGVNYYENDPLYTDFYVEYGTETREKIGHTLRTVQDIFYSKELLDQAYSNFHDLLYFGKSAIIERLKKYLGWWEEEEIEINEYIKAENRDYVIAANYTLEICEFRSVSPVNGEYIALTRPKNLQIYSRVIGNEQDYLNLMENPGGLRSEAHTIGNITTYNYLPSYFGDEIYSMRFTVGNRSSITYEYTKSELRRNGIETQWSLGIGLAELGTEYETRYGLSLSYIKEITTMKMETTPETKIGMYYNQEGRITATKMRENEDKQYDVEFVVYYDRGINWLREKYSGELIINWLVPEYGEYYTTSESGGVTGIVHPPIPSEMGLPELTGAERYNTLIDLVRRGIDVGGMIFGDTESGAQIESTYLYIDNAQMPNGSEVQIPIRIRNAEDIRNMDIELSYDPSVLRPLEALAGTLTQDALFESNIQETIKIAFVSSEGISGNGTLAEVRFQVVGEPGSETSLTLSAEGNKVNGEAVSFRIGNGVFRVVSEEERLKGDCNGDGRITSVDALIALKMAVGKEEVDLVADMNDDSRVTSFDAAQILDTGTSSTALKTDYVLRGYYPGIKGHRVVDYSKIGR